MRVGSRMLQFCTLASSGAFQAVLGMGDGFRTAQDLEGSSGIGGRHLPMRRIQDGASGSSTASPDINLELKKGKSGGMREQQCIRPPNDSKGVAGKMLTLATGGSGSLRPVKLEKMDEGSESSSGIGSGHMPMRRIQDRASGSSRPGSQDIGLDWQKAKLGGKRKQQWIDSFNDSEVMADPMTALPTGGSKSLRRVKLEKIGQGSTPLDRIRISHIKADEKLNGWIKEISAFSSELERKLDSMEINNMLAPNLALYPLLEEKFKSVRSGVTELFQEKLSQLELDTPLVDETAFKSKLKELGKNFLQSVAEIQQYSSALD
ncbi:hypothetical protein PCANC_17955 [Puccinia coronata f. sp. avenae]|uniref:Uncharacterized protein n=1 Tax=Puccinia coronata f. sp. avenae TaxID=200324 RepID=A0A2N5UR45_9BASI|nr:hypothetical protein PCASD_23528 [Puccinia coronata f. sp. avenae]PLW29441.1 hypothetical protein PCASD_18403 [Puccinia coronata f. sp. avenae]PLW40229.1 hypothetical protein PCANC_17955 [Puccinia coronata f. sp. avenae]